MERGFGCGALSAESGIAYQRIKLGFAVFVPSELLEAKSARTDKGNPVETKAILTRAQLDPSLHPLA